MRRRAPPADEHSELSSAVLRLTTQWELKQQRKEAALQATLDEAREDAEELREELEELRQSLAAARREAGDAAASAARADAEAADAAPARRERARAARRRRGLALRRRRRRRGPGAPALHRAIAAGHDDVAKLLIRSGANANAAAAALGGSTPLHTAALHNRAELARFLVAKCNARLDAVDDGGKTAAARAAEMRWSRTERVLKDPSLLFWARATRANRLCKEGEHALALESYAQALAELERVDAERRPSPANVMTLHHNRGKSLMALGKHLKAREALSAAVAIAGAPADYPAAADKRAECDAALLEHDKAAAAWEGLAASFAGETGDDAAATKAKVDAWNCKAAREREKLRFKPHEVLGLESPRPSEDEVKRAYRKMSIKWHPDRHAAASDEHKHRAHLQFQRISAANDALEKRAADPYRPYDWAPHRYDDDDDDDDDDGHSDDDDDDDDDDAEFDRARRATGPTASLLLFFRLAAATAAAAADPATAPPAVRLLQRYVAEAPACAPDEPGTRGRALLVRARTAPRLRRYNGKPVLLDRSSRVASGPGYLRSSNLRYWCYPARLAIFALWAKFSHAAVDACLVLEGRDDDELPEVALGCCALSKIDLDGAPVGWDA
ncbi:hypothetical protein JL720_12029 [Aureococcus anophagefferens]|nr:hypothetical protein JL720_12029 [Aureococcus anophagefferens]